MSCCNRRPRWLAYSLRSFFSFCSFFTCGTGEDGPVRNPAELALSAELNLRSMCEVCTLISDFVFRSIPSYFYSPYQLFKRRGIPGPTPQFFFGSYSELASKEGVSPTIDVIETTYPTVVSFRVSTVPYYT